MATLSNAKAWRQAREDFLVAQAGLCAICHNSVHPSKAKLDHCHVTGFVRGVLCASCNVKLGWYENRREAIENYLAHAAAFTAHRIANARSVTLPCWPRRRPAVSGVDAVVRDIEARRKEMRGRQLERLRRYYLNKHGTTATG